MLTDAASRELPARLLSRDANTTKPSPSQQAQLSGSLTVSLPPAHLRPVTLSRGVDELIRYNPGHPCHPGSGSLG